MFSVKNQIKDGVLVSVDLRTKGNSSGKLPEEALLIATELRAMIAENIADSYPTTEGGTTKESFEFPFLRRSHLLEEVPARLNMKRPEKSVSRTTFERAIKHLDEEHLIQISIKRNKKFMKCDTCVQLTNEKNLAETKEEKEKNRIARNNHYMQTNRQRQEYTNIRNLAKQKGGELEVFLLATDGMDQSKTALPRKIDCSHKLDAVKGALPTHVVSTLVFGGLQPIMAQINFPDVVKNSALTVVNMAKAIELQFEALMKKEKERKNIFTNENPDKIDSEEAEEKLRSWPKRLHICMDNAVGENINQNVFLYLGALVHHGIFHRVTVGTLLVGHTHNINDQLFSVWSKQLQYNDCVTPSEMKKLFEEHYHAHIKETSEEEKQRLSSSSGPEPGDLEGKKDEESSDESEEEYSFTGVKKTVKDKRRARLEVMSCLVEEGAIAKPKIDFTKVNVHIGGWYPGNLKKRECLKN